MGIVISVTVVTASSGRVHGGPALDDGKKPASSPSPAISDPVAEPPVAEADPNAPQYGVGIRLRNVRAPAGLIGLFTERATGASNFGFGVDLVRRKGTVELQLGFEYEHVQPDDGVFIESNSNVAAGDEADYIVGPETNPDGASLGWFTIEFTFLNHTVFNDYVALRYGGGAGLGIVTGALWHYNVICVGATNNNPDPGCRPMERGGTGLASSPPLEKYKLPPVFPVVNAIIGVQFRPMPKATINLEGGIRTFPFFGISGGYFF